MLSGKAPKLNYKLKANFTGKDSFTYCVNDGKLNSATVTVKLTVTALQKSPATSLDALPGSSGSGDRFPAFLTGDGPNGQSGRLEVVDYQEAVSPLEFLIAGDPGAGNEWILSALAGRRDFIFRFLSRKDSASEVSQQVQYSMSPRYGWRIAEHGRDGVFFTSVPLNASVDEITVTIPAILGVRYARVRGGR
jgi:hypothetical protein